MIVKQTRNLSISRKLGLASFVGKSLVVPVA